MAEIQCQKPERPFLVFSGRIQSDHLMSAIRSLESKTASAETRNGQEWTLRLDVEFFMTQPPT